MTWIYFGKIAAQIAMTNYNANIAKTRFHEILHELGKLHDKKQRDYGRASDPFANVRASEDFGIEPWKGAMIRANDKMRRIQKFASDGNLANESVEDSFRDLAVYTIIALILFEESRRDPNGI